MAWPALSDSQILTVLRACSKPYLFCPHYTVSTFDRLPIPLSKALPRRNGEEPDIRAVVLDKDNCFAIPHSLTVYPAYRETFERLKKEYPGGRLLIVSNSSGSYKDRGHKEAELLEKHTGVKVLRHTSHKPVCWPEIFDYLKTTDAGVTRPDQVAVVGDRLLTDMLMANKMGSWGFWVKDGIVPPRRTLFGLFEHTINSMQRWRGMRPPFPSSRTL